MSKNTDRYKADLSHLDLETLEEIETESFERFRPKKIKPGKDKKQSQKIMFQEEREQ
jgi:hypothetical protein